MLYQQVTCTMYHTVQRILVASAFTNITISIAIPIAIPVTITS